MEGDKELVTDTIENITTKLSNTEYRTDLFEDTSFYKKVVETGKNSNIINVLKSNATYKNELSAELENEWNEDLNTICYWLGENCYLFYNADECERITDGWRTMGYVFDVNEGWGIEKEPTVSPGDDHYDIAIRGGGSSPYGATGLFIPKNDINYSAYSKICIEYGANLDQYSAANIVSFYKDNLDAIYDTENEYVLCYEDEVEYHTIERFNYSSISGNYISLHLQGFNNRVSFIRVFKIWLEK